MAKIESGGTTYYHADHLSARLLTDSSGNTLGQRGHYPFGETWYETGTTTKFKFTTYERDGESGNDYALARSYVNRLGRFSSLDPLGGSSSDPQSLNRYSYARLNPMSFTDPSGKELCWGTCTDEWGGGGYAGYGGAPSGPGGVWGTTGADPSVGGGHWQAGVDQCGVNPFCLANPPGPPSSPVAQINCTTGKWRMVGSYNFSQQNNDGTWTVDWQAQWNRELSDVIAAFWNQAVRVYLQLSAKNQNLSFEDFVGFQNLDTGDPNALQPKLQGGNWNFLYDGAAQPSDCASGVGGIRCGTSPSLHYPSEKPGYVHMDTANPAAWWYGGSIVRGIVDVVLGNTFFANGIPR